LAIIQRARQLGFTLTEIRYLFFGFRKYHSGFRTLANALPKKARGVGSSDGWNKSSTTSAENADDEVPMQHLGSMWKKHI
jgi:hypothetical protein